MNRVIEIEFVEEAAVEIPALKPITQEMLPGSKKRRHFWLGWQLFRDN